jgi:large subunit ribosomal protein L22
MKSVTRHVRVQPRKARLVADSIRGLGVDEAMDVLRFNKKKGAFYIRKALASAIANAENNDKMDRRTLVVRSVIVNTGPIMRYAKRMRIRARYGTSRIHRRTSHITVTVAEA